MKASIGFAVLMQCCLAPPWVVAQVREAAAPAADQGLETSIRGHLQRRIASAYPDSFRVGIDIFWEPSDGWVSPEVLEWWKLRVAPEDHPSLKPEAASKMFDRFTTEASVFPDDEQSRICAVVGASRNLLVSGYGELIDAHDLVFRVNRAQMSGFEPDVGEKTSHHVTWPRELSEWEYNRESFLLMSPVAANNPNVFDRILNLVAEDFRWDPERVRIIHPEFFKYVHEDWSEGRHQYPSTGMVTLMLALHVCDEVNVFGFGADGEGRWDRYYEDAPEDAGSFHPVDFEGQLRDELESKGLLEVYRGNRP